jgi:hypothetical protein
LVGKAAKFLNITESKKLTKLQWLQNPSIMIGKNPNIAQYDTGSYYNSLGYEITGWHM